MFSEWSGFLEQEIINRRAGVGFDHFDVLSLDVNNLRQKGFHANCCFDKIFAVISVQIID